MDCLFDLHRPIPLSGPITRMVRSSMPACQKMDRSLALNSLKLGSDAAPPVFLAEAAIRPAMQGHAGPGG